MRRHDREVTDPAQIADIMSRCEICRFAMNDENVPYILPVNFGMEPDGMTVYFHGAKEGTKYRIIEKDNRASFEMECSTELVLDADEHECSMVYESVIGWGNLIEITQPEEKIAALRRIMAQYHHEDFPFSLAPLARTRVFKLCVQGRTAKRRRKMA